MINRSMS